MPSCGNNEERHLMAADSSGLTDHGEITIGRRCDIARLHRSPHHLFIPGDWRQGRRVA